jgi:alcohol dehydrogenase class IV
MRPDDFFKMSDIFMFQIPRKIIFGNGAIRRIGEEAANIFAGKKILMITDKGVVQAGLTDEAAVSLKKNGFDVIVFDGVLPDPPVSVVLECIALARKERVDIIFGIGGGSSIDAAKAVSLFFPYEGDIYSCIGLAINKVKNPGLPKIFVPTTAGTGADLSNSFVLTDDRTKEKISSNTPYAFSDLSIIDPALTLNLPPKITAESGMDAFSHSLESFVSLQANPLSDLFALRGIELISKNIRKAYSQGPKSPEARYAMCFAVCMGTMALRSSRGGAIHPTCYPLAMKYRLTHGLSISLMMPYVMEYNLTSDLKRFAAVASGMGERIEGFSTEEAAHLAVKAVKRLMGDLGLPLRLRDIGVKKEDFAEFARFVTQRYPHYLVSNPRKVSEQDIIGIYESAW